MTTGTVGSTTPIPVTNDTGGHFDYIAGLFFQNAEIDTNFDLHTCIPFFPVCMGPGPFPPPGTRVITTRQDGETIATFGQGTWHFNNQFSTTFSARFTHEEKDATGEQFAALLYTKTRRPPGGATGLGNEHLLTASIVENNLSPGGNIQWRPNEDVVFYFSGSRGFKGGGFDHQLNASQPGRCNQRISLF